MTKLRDGFISRLDINPAELAVAFAVWILPIVSIEFVWLQFFTPLPVFFILVEARTNRGINTLAGALLITGLTATAVGASTAFFFSVTMLPVGYILARSMALKSAPVMAGGKSFLVILLGWSAWSLLYTLANHASLYHDILANMDQGLTAASKTILASPELPSEQARMFETAVERLRNLVPHIMPGLLLVTMLNVVFATMVIGQWLLRKKDLTLSTWPPFAEWRLPEPFVATAIVAGFLLMLPEGILKDAGLNLAFLVGTLYFFQGLSVITGLFAKWKVPFWVLLLSMLFFQVYGFVFLAVLGLADVWVDFSKRKIDIDNINL